MRGARASRLLRRGAAAATTGTLVLLSLGAVARAEETARPAFADLQPAPTPAAAFETNAYLIIHVGKTGTVGEEDSTWRPVRGLVYRIDTDPAVFFESAGRLDLAGEARAHHHAIERLSVGGYVLGIAGVAVTLWGASVGRTAVWAGGLGAIVGGIILHETGESMRDEPPLPERQALDVASDYNRQLRARLGLPPEAEPSKRDRWSLHPLTLAPLPLPRGAGVGFAGHF
jgi:hypothetical protein